jgi:hypothetical protein
MNAHDNTPNKPSNDRDAVVIPLPRTAPDDDIESLPPTGSDQAVWRYYQGRKRGANRSFSGHATSVGGAEGERLRGELAAVIGELLDWAARQSHNESIEDGEAA